MQLIILCGGFGTRLREVIGEKQKTMANVQGRPFLLNLIENYRKQNIKDIIFACGYKAEEIIEYFGDGNSYGMKFYYAKEDNPLGTGGAIKNAYNIIKNLNNANEYTFVTNGDTLFDCNLDLLLNNAKKLNTDMSIVIKNIEDKKRYGSITIKNYDDKIGGIITNFEEKIDTDADNKYINGGVYVLKNKLIETIPLEKLSIENDLIPKWLKEGRLIGCIKSDADFIDIGTKESYERINKKNIVS